MRGTTIALVLIAAGGGCSATGPVPEHGTRSGLVVPLAAGDERPDLRVDPGAWEFGRNDERLNAGREPYIDGHGWAEFRTRARLRTSNGLPREFSSTDVRTFRRRGPR